MAKFPALPLYTDAIIADCNHLTDAEFGLYMRMLILMWRTPQCKFPNDNLWIARRFLKPIDMYDKEVMPLLYEFFTCDGNWWRQKRLSEQYDYAGKHSRKMSDNAKSRWDKEKDSCKSNAPKPKPKPTTLSNDKLVGMTPKPPNKSKNIKTRLPEDWLLPEELGKWAEDQGLQRDEVIFQARKFHDWTKSNAVTKSDWPATWRNWIRNKKEFKR